MMNLESKKCPVCKEVKSTDYFYKYFSKVRQKFRISNYCIDCGRTKSNIRAKEHYRQNREKKIAYARVYEKAHYERHLELQRNIKKRRRENLEDLYVKDLMTCNNKFKKETLQEVPELVQVYRTKLLLKRTLKKIKNGKKQITGSQ